MNRLLDRINGLGVLVLTALCILQWTANRRAHGEIGALAKARSSLAREAERQARDLKGQAADLEDFRERLATASAAWKEAEARESAARREIRQLEATRDQLQGSVTHWAAAVTARDQRLSEVGLEVRRVAGERNAAVEKFNDLAAKHGALVTTLNERTRQLNELIVRTSGAKPAPTAPAP